MAHLNKSNGIIESFDRWWQTPEVMSSGILETLMAGGSESCAAIKSVLLSMEVILSEQKSTGIILLLSLKTKLSVGLTNC